MIEILLPVALLLLLLVVGAPIGFALAISGCLGLFLIGDLEFLPVLLTNAAYGSVSSFLLTTIPMFILMAQFLTESNITAIVFKTAHRWLGSIRGGLAIATAVASGGMAALSGSSTATSATMAGVAVPEMKKYGYDDRLSLGTVSAAGTFAVLFPPSLALIIYGVMTETSIADLFIAGIVPGLATLFGYTLIIVGWASYDPPVVGERESFTLMEKLDALRGVWSAVVIVFLVVGGLYLGVVTPTEAGALGAAGTLVVGVVVGGMRLSGIKNALLETALITSMIFMIVIGAFIFNDFLARSGAARELVDAIAGLPVNKYVILLIILGIYILLGTVMDQLAILILTLPVVFPLVTSLGFDPVWFGILLVKTIEVGLVTPPLGMNVYIASAAVDMDPMAGFRGSARFLLVDLAIIIVLILYPDLVFVLL